jgi:hypothetical protein
MLTCVSSNLVLYGVSFVVHSSSGMVRIVIVLEFSYGLMYGFMCIFFVVWVGISNILPFV